MWRIIRLAALALFASIASCLHLNPRSPHSIRNVSAALANGLFSYHNDSSLAGQFNQPAPWFWWQSGAAWAALMDYQSYTGDTTYQSAILSALARTSNIGENYDFVPTAQKGYEANDDQAYWVYTALTAAEYDFPALPCKRTNTTSQACANSWLALASNAFNDFVTRWENDSATCGGGIEWQYNANATGQFGGATYKNSVSNGGFFQIAARLARLTGNQTYSAWATEIWDWSVNVGLVGPGFHVFDGTGDGNGANCSSLNHDEWSYNLGTYLIGAANMYNSTSGSEQNTWESIVSGLLAAANGTFFTPFSNATGVMYEQICEKAGNCDTDQPSFKGSLANWMGKTAVLVPATKPAIMSLLRPSAKGAVASCSGLGNDSCGVKWYIDGFDGETGLAEQLSALEVVQALLVGDAPALATASAA